MRIACSTSAFDELFKTNQMTVSDFFRIASSFGIEAVELQVEHLRSLNEPYFASLLKEAEREGVVVVALSFNNRFGFPNEDVRDEELKRISHLIRVARDIGARVIRLVTGEGKRMEAHYEEQKRWVVDAFLKVAEVAEDLDVSVAIENSDEVCLHPDELLWLLDEVNSPCVGACLNAFNLLASCGFDNKAFYEAAEMLAPFSMHSRVVFTGFDEKGNDKLINYSRLMSIFAESEYDGFHCIAGFHSEPLDSFPIAVKLLLKSIEEALKSFKA
jgi:sugar phosphate isomerase/epimerase